jgi:spore maturation protein A
MIKTGILINMSVLFSLYGNGMIRGRDDKGTGVVPSSGTKKDRPHCPRRKGSMNKLWLGLIFLGLLFSFINKSPQTVTNVLFFEIEKSVDLILNLISIMAFWIGLMRVAEKTNILNKLSSALKPFVGYLFEDVQNNLKAVNAILLTLAANLMGIGNSATAFGIKAMEEMQKANLNKKRATNAMCMFLIINVSSIQLIPLNIIKLRADSGSSAPSEIMVPTLIVTIFSTMVAIISGKYFERKGS